MSIRAQAHPGSAPARLGTRGADWLAIAGFTCLAVPTLIADARQVWTTEQGEQGPIVLAIGAWLLYGAWPRVSANARPGSPTLSAALFAAAALAYLLGRLADLLVVENYALFGLMIAGLYVAYGWRSLRAAWFPLAYVLLALPAPYTVTWLLTSHLRILITQAVVSLFHLLGFAVVRDGLTILIDQYQLAVQDACSGMNSLISLTAIGMVYVYLRHPSVVRVVSMLPLVVALAIFGNFVRVAVLVAITHYWGDAAAQGYLHDLAGFVTFLAAMLGVIVIDWASGPAIERLGRRASS